MGYTALQPIMTGGYDIIAIDTEQDDNADPYVWCVAGFYKGKKIERTFYSSDRCGKYLFNEHKHWTKVILTGFNIKFDLNTLFQKGVFEWELLEKQGSFITAIPPKDLNRRNNSLKIIEASNFHPGKRLVDVIKDKDGNFTEKYLWFINEVNSYTHIDKHILGKDGNKEEMRRACISHAWAAVYALYDIQKQIRGLNSQIELTPALTAQKLHRRNYLEKECQILPIHSSHITDEVKLFMDKSYYGGRTENMIKADSKNVIKGVTGIDINCFSEDTELLTIDGYKKYMDLSIGDIILTLNIKTGDLEYQPIEHIHVYDYENELIHIKNENIDILATPNHRIYYQFYHRNKKVDKEKYKTWSNFKIRDLKDIPKSYIRLPTGGNYNTGSCDIDKNWIKLLGWIITEGWFYKDGNGIAISQSDKYNYHIEIREILNNLKINYTETNRGKRNSNNISYNSNYDEYVFYIPAKYGKIIKKLLNNKKEINHDWIKNWDKESLKILFWELMKGDGSFKCQLGKASFVSHNYHDLECMTEICLKIGYKSSINYNNNTLHIKLNMDGKFANVNIHNKGIWKTIDYKGKVWCVTTLNKTMVVKRNGKTFITGNSSYPNVMRNNEYPDIITYREVMITKANQLIKYMKEYEGLAWIEIESPNDQKIMLLPFINDDKLCFPKGRWVGTYTFPEIRKALEVGYKIINVWQVGICKLTKKPLFKKYVDELYKLKKDPEYKAIAKLMLNSLYGKFGQKANEKSGWQPVLESEIPDNIFIDLDGVILDDKKGHISNDWKIYNDIVMQYIPESPLEERGFSRTAYPLLAAYVTSYARIFLYEAMEAIGLDKVYYCDTDSIYGDTKAINKAIKDGKLKIDKENLGEWDIEHHNCDMEIRGLKYYRTKENNYSYLNLSGGMFDFEFSETSDWEYVIKGVPKRFHAEFWQNKKISYERPVKLTSAIRFNKKVNLFETVSKSDRKPEAKRVFHSDNDSSPIIIYNEFS